MPLGLALAIPAAMQAVGIGAELIGGHQANAANAHQAQQNRLFQERMSNTSYQRAVADMRAAGLNPALAYQQGGASSPTGSTATITNAMAGAGGNARAAAQTYQDIQTAVAQREAIKAQTEKTRAEAAQVQIESAARIESLKAAARLADQNATTEETFRPLRNKKLWGEANVSIFEGRNAEQNAALRLQQLQTLINLGAVQARDVGARADLAELAKPGMTAQAWKSGTIVGKYVSPWLGDAKAVLDALKLFHQLSY